MKFTKLKEDLNKKIDSILGDSNSTDVVTVDEFFKELDQLKELSKNEN